MAITYTEVQPIDSLRSLLKFTSDQLTPVHFRPYLDGVAAGDWYSDDGTGELTIAVGEDLEILDRDVAVPRVAFPSRWTLYWPEVAGTVYYRVDELVGGVWTERAKVPDDGRGHFTWRTGVLKDTTLYQFRVVPVMAGDLEAEPIPFKATMVRRPDPPAVTWAYSAATGKVTIGA